MNIQEAIKKGGSRRDTLEALRDKLAVTIDTTESARDVASCSRQLREVLQELDSLPDASKKLSPLDVARKNAGKK